MSEHRGKRVHDRDSGVGSSLPASHSQASSVRENQIRGQANEVHYGDRQYHISYYQHRTSIPQTMPMAPKPPPARRYRAGDHDFITEEMPYDYGYEAAPAEHAVVPSSYYDVDPNARRRRPSFAKTYETAAKTLEELRLDHMIDESEFKSKPDHKRTIKHCNARLNALNILAEDEEPQTADSDDHYLSADRSYQAKVLRADTLYLLGVALIIKGHLSPPGQREKSLISSWDSMKKAESLFKKLIKDYQDPEKIITEKLYLLLTDYAKLFMELSRAKGESATILEKEFLPMRGAGMLPNMDR